MDYEKIFYNMPCLTQVIIRLDFREFVDSELLFNQSVEETILPNYSQKGMQQLIRFETMSIVSDSNGARTEKSIQNGIQQEYSNVKNNKLVISNKFVVMEINNYSKFEDELSTLIPVLKKILTNTQLTVVRTGIRYINLFSDEGIKPQKSFFNPPVSALVDLNASTAENMNGIRTMTLSEYLFDDMRLNFRYGQPNVKYPQPIKKLSFVLDYDCFCEEALSGLDKVIEHINMGHNAIQKIFEGTITNKLRKVME